MHIHNISYSDIHQQYNLKGWANLTGDQAIFKIFLDQSEGEKDDIYNIVKLCKNMF